MPCPNPMPLAKAKALIDLPEDHLVRVYTYQVRDVLDRAERIGHISGSLESEIQKMKEENDLFYEPYVWMWSQMYKRIPEFSGEYPVWAWAKRPLTRKESTKGRVIALVPRKRIVFSDYEEWHLPLNRGPIAKSEEEADRLHEEGVEAIKETWTRVFDFEPRNDPWVGSNRNVMVQACIDRIYMDEIVSIDGYK